ncbi:MAG: ribonuclease E inhibitor RraB [Eubacteriaceae bacterium]|nr:ribonuclease E inhibitor RraB [Eubacteriaceae bacterium]
MGANRKSKSAALVFYTVFSVMTCVSLIAAINSPIAGIVTLVLLTALSCIFYVSKTSRIELFTFVLMCISCSAVSAVDVFYILDTYRAKGSFFYSIATFVLTFMPLITAASLFQPELNSSLCDSTYKNYKAACRVAWFHSLANCISNRSAFEKVIRIAVMTFFSFLGVLSISNAIISGSPVVQSNIILYLTIALCGFLFFLIGIRYALATSFALLLIGFASRAIAQKIFDILPNIDMSYLSIFTASCLFLVCASLAVIWVTFRWDLFYSNVQVYERGEDSIAIDLFLNECKPIKDLQNLVSFQIKFDDLRELAYSIKTMLNSAHATKSVLAGYYCDNALNQIEFYMYTSNGEKLEQKLQKSLPKLDKLDIKPDPRWLVYDTLFPTEVEMGALANRFQIERLYSKGLKPNQQYEINFYVAFKNKIDPINFENKISHLGFKLTFASYPEMPSESGYNFFGEYRIKSYITTRRIDYLCEKIKLTANDYDAMFSLDWLVET